MDDSRRTASAIVAAVVLALSMVLGACGGGSDKGGGSDAGGEDLQTVSFQKPTDSGDDPFTPASDVQGSSTVKLTGGSGSGGSDSGGSGQGPYGGTGSDLVCDRELLIKSLKAKPDRMREWARVVGIDPDFNTVAKYIRSLKPVTLTEDTQVTNHSFVNGRATPYQAILQKGTAVLVDKYGKPVARCRCGNPLTEPVYYPKFKCKYCPPHYRPPKPCWDDGGYDGGGYDDEEAGGYGSSYSKPKYDYRRCYEEYDDPPPVEESREEPQAEAASTPPPSEPQYEEPQYEEPQQQEPQYEEPQHPEPSEPGGGGYHCEEADSPDRFEEGCQGELVPNG